MLDLNEPLVVFALNWNMHRVPHYINLYRQKGLLEKAAFFQTIIISTSALIL
jgi:hypothetical protein